MDNESQEFNLSRHQKSRLLSLGLGSKPRELSTDKVEQKADMLYDVLTRTLPVDPSVVDSLPSVVKGMSSRLHSLAGRPIGDLLKDPTTDIATIKKIKQYAKESGTSADSKDKGGIFLAVYYAAIASALLFHGKKITRHPYEDLQEFFLSFSREMWVLEEIKDLFQKAQMHCERIIGSDSN